MGERIGQAFNHRAVHLGRVPFGAQTHRLAGGIRHLAHNAGHALEQQFHRLRTNGHDAFLNFTGQLLKGIQAGQHIG